MPVRDRTDSCSTNDGCANWKLCAGELSSQHGNCGCFALGQSWCSGDFWPQGPQAGRVDFVCLAGTIATCPPVVERALLPWAVAAQGVGSFSSVGTARRRVVEAPGPPHLTPSGSYPFGSTKHLAQLRGSASAGLLGSGWPARPFVSRSVVEICRQCTNTLQALSGYSTETLHACSNRRVLLDYLWAVS